MSDPLVSPHLSAPLTFWSRPEVLQALETHDAGALLRLIRQHTGASQQRIGAAVDMAQPRISALMANRHEVTALRTWKRLADGLTMPDAARRIIGLADSTAVLPADIGQIHTLPASVDDLWSAPRTVGDIAEITVKDLMKRREALAIGGALIVGTALTEILESWSAPSTHHQSRVGGTIGADELRRIEAATQALRHWGDRWRLGIRRKAIVGQLSEVAELVEAPQPAPVQARIFVVMAELSKIIAAMSYDAGDHPHVDRTNVVRRAPLVL